MIIEIVRIVVKQTGHERLNSALSAWAGPITAEAGCISCRILEEKNDPQAVYYQAQWKTQEDLLRHLRADHYRRLLGLMELGTGPPLVEFHTVSETKGLDLVESARNAV